MKILLANKFYYRRGGDCVHTLNLEQLLKAHGHEVAVFAMDYPENLKTQWSKYFPSEVKFKLGTGMIEALMRPFGTRERYSGSSMRCSMISIRMWYISTTSIRNFRRSLQRWRTKGV